jgi:hypothetical protein
MVNGTTGSDSTHFGDLATLCNGTNKIGFQAEIDRNNLSFLIMETGIPLSIIRNGSPCYSATESEPHETIMDFNAFESLFGRLWGPMFYDATTSMIQRLPEPFPRPRPRRL